MTAVSDTIQQVAEASGLPGWIPLDIARYESSLNPNSVGDNGTSFGLFQLHKGGLLGSLTQQQAFDPATNASVAVSAMLPAYKRGISQGLAGEDLLDYVAFSSGWPGQLGVSWTQRNRPDYVSGLHNVYVAHLGDTDILPTNGSTQGGRTVPSSLQDVYQTQASTSAPAAVFRSISGKEQIDSYQTWKGKQTKVLGLSLGNLNPFGYVFDQGQALMTRGLIVLLALAICIIAVLRIVQPSEPVGGPDMGGVPNV